MQTIESKSKRYAIIIITSFLLLIVGWTDAIFGSLIEPLENYYGYTERIISLAFLFYVVGSITSSYISTICIQKLGLKYFIILMSVLYIAGALVDAFRPKQFPAYVFGVYLLGIGTGAMQTSATAVLSHFENGPLMTLVYCNMGLGSLISPFIIGAFIEKDIDFKHNFWIIVGFGAILIVASWFVFDNFDTHQVDNKTQMTIREKLRIIIPTKQLWIGLLAETGLLVCQDSFSQWVAPYIKEVKNLQNGKAQYMTAGFWGGLTIGRIALAHVSDKLGKRKSSIALYSMNCAFLAGLWKVEGLAGVTVLCTLIGFVLGPLMPNTLSIAVDYWPRELKDTSTSVIMATSLFGSLLGPHLLSQAADQYSLKIVPPVLIVECFITAIIVGLTFVTIPRNNEEDQSVPQPHKVKEQDVESYASGSNESPILK